VRLDHLLSKEHTPSLVDHRGPLPLWWWGGWCLTSGIIDEPVAVVGACLSVLPAVQAVLVGWVWNLGWVRVVVAVLAHCWALRNQAPAGWMSGVGLVGLLFLDFWIVDASIARTWPLGPASAGWGLFCVGVCFCSVCLCSIDDGAPPRLARSLTGVGWLLVVCCCFC